MIHDKLRPLKTSIRFCLLVCAFSLFFISCSDDIIVTPVKNAPDGTPATITIGWNDVAVSRVSRSALSDAEASRVNDLWIGIYDANTGDLKNSLYQDRGGEEGQHTPRTLTIKTSSGQSYIVGVANVSTNYGISDNAELRSALGLSDENPGIRPIVDFLEKADTWEKFKSISGALTDSTSVSQVSADLLMSGIYYEKTDDDPDDWTAVPQSVYIPAGELSLPGAIHLRRMQSYVKVNLKPGNGITIEPISWQIFNSPIICSLYEQDFNAADVSQFLLPRTEDKDNYGTSQVSYNFESASGSDAGSYSFDMYLFENKHTGLEWVTTYADREKEHKIENTEPDGGNLNTGIYASLCSDARTPDTTLGINMNNYATYMRIVATITYKTEIEIDGVKTEVDRIGTAVYTVHLGYCEGDTEAMRARDFNNRRNTWYTYNITINGLNDIVVEAQNDNQEPAPGAEGNVNDMYEQAMQLDSHYCTFNISLSNRERAAMTYKIRAPYAGTDLIINSDDSDGTEYWQKKNPDNQFYSWITFLPAPSETALAKYPGTGSSSLMYLDDLKDVAGHPGYNGSTNVNSDTQQWYTVFIDEYVYHRNVDGD